MVVKEKDGSKQSKNKNKNNALMFKKGSMPTEKKRLKTDKNYVC
jgi:hypothetical protein